MAKLANKRIYIIKERASRERHTEKNTDLCSVRENKNILQGRQTLYSYLQTLIYSLPVPIYLCLIVLEVEDGAGANILPRHPIIHVKDEGGSKRHIIENNAIPT